MAHNYARENKWESSPQQVKNRVARNKARRHALAAGLVHKGDKKEVDHKHPLALGGSNRPDNWRIISRHQNRAAGSAIKSRLHSRGH